jgi:N-acetylneuraminic acid mutarotase
MLGLCLVAAVAVAAIATTSASALPEWGQCFKKGAGGKFEDVPVAVELGGGLRVNSLR